MSIKSYPDYLTCVDDSNEANQVCGTCGTPLCDEHAERTPTFTGSFAPDSWQTVLMIGALLVGVPVLFYVLAPDILGTLRRALIPGVAIFPKPGLVQSAVILGLALTPRVWYRTTDGSLGYEPLVRKSTEQVLCEDCRDQYANLRVITYGTYVVAGVAVAIGLVGFLSGPDFGMLRLVALGVGVYLIKDELVAILT